MGGLRAGHSEPCGARTRTIIRGAWTRVGAATGQPFDISFLDREGFVYDTEPACRAVVTARRLLPRLALPFMGRIAAGLLRREPRHDLGRGDCRGGRGGGLRPRGVRRRLPAPETRNETFRDFLTAQELGIRGFPTLIAGSEEKGYALVTNGYRPLDDLLEPLERWWAAGAPVTKTG